MRGTVRRLSSVVVFCVVGGASLRAQAPPSATSTAVPRVMWVNGALHLASGPPAPVEIVTFAIYAEETGGQPLWQETQNVTLSEGGQYTALLGSKRPDGLPLDVFTSKDARWLEVHVERSGEPPTPRVLLASVPYALRASDADTLGGRPSSAYLLAEPVVDSTAAPGDQQIKSKTPGGSATTQTAGALNSLGKFVSPTDLGTSAIWDLGGFVGINTTTPLDILHLRFNDSFGAFTGLAVQNLSSSGNASSGMLFYDQNGALGQFQGFNNLTHEYRINNIAPGGTINFLIGNTSRFQVLNSGDISISGALLKSGMPFLHNSGQSTFAGLNSGNFSMTGGDNTGFGALTLRNNTLGTDNVAVGAGTLDNNTIGNFNTAVGRSALHFNVEGRVNTAVGYGALFSNNTGIQNTAVGTTTMDSNTTGHSNTAIGQSALGSNTTGTNNTAVGFLAGSLATTGSTNIYLGALVQGVAGESNTMYLGGSFQDRTFIGGVRGVITGVGDAVAVVIDSSGQLGTVNSSRRYKEDIQDMGNASSGLMNLRPVTFRYAQPYANGSKPIDYGLIAEEVEAVYPDLVAHLADGQLETVQYHKINAMLLNEVQKQHAELRQQQAEIAALKARLDALERERR